MKSIMKNNLIDLTIFTGLTMNDVFKSAFDYLLGALIIVIVNSLLIPLFKILIEKIKEKTSDEVDEVLDDFRDKVITEVEKEVKKYDKK